MNKKIKFKACVARKTATDTARELAFYAEQQGGKAMHCGLIYLK